MNITIKDWNKLKSFHCDKSKHRFRTNKFGVTWCTICGTLSNKPSFIMNDNDKLTIIKNN